MLTFFLRTRSGRTPPIWSPPPGRSSPGPIVGMLHTYDGELFHTPALRGTPQPFREYLTREPIRPGPETGLARMANERRPVHIADLAAERPYQDRDPLRVASVELGGARSFLAV